MEEIPDYAHCFDFHPCHDADYVEPGHAASGKVQLLQSDDAILPEYRKGWAGAAHDTPQDGLWQGHIFGTEWAEGLDVVGNFSRETIQKEDNHDQLRIHQGVGYPI